MYIHTHLFLASNQNGMNEESQDFQDIQLILLLISMHDITFKHISGNSLILVCLHVYAIHHIDLLYRP